MTGVHLGIEGLGAAEAIGSGGNAIVYRAREEAHDRWVAVKVLRGMGDEAERRRFDRERRAMGRLSQHDGIVPVYASGFTDQGEPFITMPLFEGGSLQDRLDDSGPVTVGEAVSLISEIAATIHHAHDVGIIHRDLKPGNILMSSAGRPLVADFGIARQGSSSASLRSTAVTLSPGYSPPETVGGEAASAAADIYALGATLFALLTGSAPFARATDENIFAILMRVANDPVENLRPRGIPDHVCAAIETAMEKDPSRRHGSAAEFAGALQNPVATPTAAQAQPTYPIPTPAPTQTRATTPSTATTPTAGPTPTAEADPALTVEHEVNTGGLDESVTTRGGPTMVEPPPTPPRRDPGPQRSGSRSRKGRWLMAGGVVIAGLAGIVSIVLSNRPEPTPSSETGATSSVVSSTTTDQTSVTTVAPGTQGTTIAQPPLVPPRATYSVGGELGRPAVGGGSLWIPRNASDGPGELVRFDPETGTVVGTINVGRDPTTPTLVDDTLWASQTLTSSVAVIDVASGSISDVVPVGEGPRQPVLAEGLLWISNLLADTVTVIDPTTHAVVATVAVGSRPDVPLVARGRAWVPSVGDGTLTVIDVADRNVVATLEVGDRPATPVERDGVIWVPLTGDDVVVPIDADTLTPSPPVTVGSGPGRSVFVGRHLFVPNSGGASVSVIDADTTELVDTIPVGVGPQPPVEIGGRLYVANLRSVSVSVIDPAERSVIAIRSTGRAPTPPVELGDAVWVATPLDGIVSDLGRP